MAAGNVGIGTTTMINKFNITGGPQSTNSGAYISFLQAGNTIGLNRQGMFFDYNTTSHYGVIQCEWYGHANYPLCLNPNGSNVGIGTTAPNASYLLDVAGSIKCTSVYQTSDRRIKTNINAIDIGCCDIINRITPRSYNYITDISGENVSYGFIADELQEILPTLVQGEKDAVFEDGTPNVQAIHYTEIIPFLVGAIQEQNKIIIKLQADIAKINLLLNI